MQTTKIWTNEELDEWLERRGPNKALYPQLPFIDPHHHVFPHTRIPEKASLKPPGPRELTLSRTFGRAPLRGWNRDDWQRDVSDLNLVATVYIEAHVQYDITLADPAVGETKFVRELHESRGRTGFCKGVVAAADLTRPLKEIERCIRSHHEALRGATCVLSGIRMQLAYSEEFLSPSPPSIYNKCFDGAKYVGETGLPIDIWLYPSQIKELCELAKGCPKTIFVCDHLATPTEGRTDFKVWLQDMERLATFRNVVVKCGGLGMQVCGNCEAEPLSHHDIVAKTYKWIKAAFDFFGEDRIIFESNFPMDKACFSYVSFWNAAQIMAGMCCPKPQGRRKMLFSNANRLYSLGLTLPAEDLYNYPVEQSRL